MAAFSPGPSRRGGELGTQGQAEACVPQSSRALTTVTHWLGPDLEAAVNLSPIPAFVT